MYEKLRDMRKREGVTVKTLSKIIGLKTDAAYFKKETGITKFTVDEAISLAKYFNTTVEFLFDE